MAFLGFLRCVGQALCAKGVRGLLKQLPFGELILDVAGDAVQRLRQEQCEEALRGELQEMVQASQQEVKRQAEAVVQEVAPEQPEPVRQALAAYLSQIPACARQSFKRPNDPTGRTAPARLSMQKVEDLLPLLPLRLPRYQPGERAAGMGDWELVELLGVGGFGEVWKAKHIHFDGIPPVALKFCLDPALKDRLLRHEASVLNQVMRQGKHPGIITLLDAQLSLDPPCLKYEFVEGGDLTSLLQDCQRLPKEKRPESVAKIVQHLASIIGHAHRLDPPIVHRDLKPANVLVQRTTDGRFKLRVADFGIGGIAASHSLRQAAAGATTRGDMLATSLRGSHTPLYASPQQIKGEAPDVRDDVHALGVIWYQLLTGDFSVGLPPDWTEELRDLGVSEGMVRLLGLCVASRPEKRPADATLMAEQLRLKQDDAEAVRQHRKAAEQGDAHAQFNLACVYDAGRGVKQDHAEAARWYRKAAEQAYAGAQVSLGFMYENGRGVDQDYAEAARWYRRAAEQGSADAQSNLGVMYETGKGVEQDYAEAARWYRNAAEQGHANAQFNLAILYHSGRGIEQDYAEALRWYREAAEQGDESAQNNLGSMYQNAEGVEQDAPEAARWYRAAAEQGNAEAQNNLGCLYANGKGVKRKYVEAAKWWRQAAEQGHAGAQCNLGWLYGEGKGVDQDYAEALRWYRKAAEQGDESAQNDLGCMYRDGKGVEQEYAEAARWYRQAAERGYAEAQNNLGCLYLGAQGVPGDKVEAARWFQLAAAQKHPKAENNLARCR